MHGTILVYGNDVMLLTTRRMIFEKEGYTVSAADSLSNAALVLINHQIDVLVLCQSLSDEERRAVLETAHTFQPEIKVAALSFDGREVLMEGVSVHRALDGPPSLLAAIGQMLQEKTTQYTSNLENDHNL
jgi:DNA-binding NtrC family response regulator